MKIIPVYVFIFLLGIVFAQAAFYFPVMPETMASHFGFGGVANGRSSKSIFFMIEAFILLISVLSFIVMPWTFEKFKVRKSLNLPNKDYWTEPERIGLFYKYFRESFAWFGSVTLILLIGTLQLVFEANFKSPPVLNEKIFLIIFGGYLTFVIIWMISFYRKFSKTE